MEALAKLCRAACVGCVVIELQEIYMKFHTSIVQARYESPLGVMIVAATDSGIAGVWFEGQKHMPDATTWPHQPDHPMLRADTQQIDDYFAGRRATFDLPLDHCSPAPPSRRCGHWPSALL